MRPPFPERPPRRAALLACATFLLGAARPAEALMVGAAPDTPQAHVDPNRNDSPWSSAVAVLVNGAPYSGVVVAPHHVLTAEHVVGTRPPAELQVQVNVDANPRRLAVTQVQRFPTVSFPYDDLALLTLADAVPAEVRIAPILRSMPAAGSVITLVGYGASGPGNLGISVPAQASVKRTVRNAVDAVQPTVDASGRRSLFFAFDFDGPSPGPMGGPGLGNAIEGSLASGDSGSPAFISQGGQTWLLGIGNLVAPPAGSTGVTFQFGSVCGGMLLSDPRFIAWLEEHTHGTLGQQASREGEAPLPAWALLGLGAGLFVARRRHQGAAGA